MKNHIVWLICTAAVASTIPACLAFNIDTRHPEVFRGEPGDFFGYRVLQYLNKSSNNKGIVVTAPLRLNGSGGIYQPDQNKWFNPSVAEDLQSNKTVVKHLGLSIAADSSGSRFTVCSPSLVHECNENSYLNSICYELSDHLQKISSFKPSYQECIKKTVDLVFLFDGSASLTQNEFNRNKDFIVEIMNSLKNMSIKFAAVQFSSTVHKVFDFNDYEAGRALDKLMKENHLKSLTNTHRAIEFVLDEIFDNNATGASPDATKVLILITDGDPSDTDKNKIIKKYDEKKIIRLVIGIKDAKLDKFRAIASEPKDKNAFKIENYDGLTGLLENFQKDVFVMEGSKVAQAGNLTDEMSQSGFSAVFNKDTLILGSVGTNSWRGSLQERRDKMETQIEDQEMEMDSYMGYSVSVGERAGVSLYFTGAPRFQHTGQVVLFKQNSNNWTTAQRITGDQIGSYFGTELCSVDIDSDGDTDFLLVGAPTFYQPQEKKEGQIYIYSLTDELQLKSELIVTGPSMGRFGTTISSLADLNGDGLRDVAVGAPLEDDNRGAVYIYLGDRHRGIRSTFSQRITGKEVTPGIKFFGQAIDGAIDLGGNGLPDIVIGSQGAAVVFRAKPIFDVMAHLTFQPKEINTEIFDCLGTDENLPMVTLTACFEMVKVTKSKQEAVRSGLNITFTLAVDPMRQKHRGVFSQTDKTARSLTSTYEMLDETACFNFSIYMHECVSNLLSPISIKFNFSQADNETAATTLNVDSKRQSVVEVPFKKACRKNDTCIAELDVDFSFMTTQLLVAEDAYFTVSIKLANHGDDSYNTMLTMHYPPGLSFRRMTVIESSRSTPHKCLDLEGVLDKTVCGVSLPLFRSRSSATFESSFYVMHDFEWDDSISMTIDANSDNQDSNRTSVLTKNIPVQFEIKMILTVKQDSTTYLNFTTEDTAPKEMGITYRNKTQCTATTTQMSEDCLPENKCITMVCKSFNLEKYSAAEFTLLGKAHFRDLEQKPANLPFIKKYTGDSGNVEFVSSIHVGYDNDRFVLESLKQKKKDDFTTFQFPIKKVEVQFDFIIPPNKLLIISTGVSLGLMLLIVITVVLFKLGCFKRRKLTYHIQRERTKATENVKETYKSTVISNIQVQ
ncbi:integrin alpha-L-like isoform X2 [Oreochromis aureus]|uniref:integrin alpha-L-like isoform X2 n=1 Tax=Oreochromis aureus TaxID=47969 RepID=UPI001953F2D0|nr:integrin alpha-L-like isoform X2 [Oreochromis aureus]